MLAAKPGLPRSIVLLVCLLEYKLAELCSAIRLYYLYQFFLIYVKSTFFTRRHKTFFYTSMCTPVLCYIQNLLTLKMPQYFENSINY